MRVRHASRLSGATRGVALDAQPFRLDRRTRNRTVGAEHAAVARLRPQRRTALRACIEDAAGVRRHCLRFCRCAMRTGNERFKDHRAFLKRRRVDCMVHQRAARRVMVYALCRGCLAFPISLACIAVRVPFLWLSGFRLSGCVKPSLLPRHSAGAARSRFPLGSSFLDDC